MISKEELQKFRMSLYNPDTDVRIIWAQNNTLDEIEKDLDILRILKSNFNIRVESSSYIHKFNKKVFINHYICICDSNNNYVVSRPISSATADKIREWLDGFTHITIEEM